MNVTPNGKLGTRIDTNGDFTPDATGWTLGKGWVWVDYYSGSVYRTGTGLAPATCTVTVVEGNYYNCEVTVQSMTSGSLTVAIGEYTILITAAGTYTCGFRAYSSGDVQVLLTGSALFNGYISSVKFYQV